VSSHEIIIEKLLEQRDLNLNLLKHLDFELIMDPTEEEIQYVKNLQTITIAELKKIEQEISFLSSKNQKIP